MKENVRAKEESILFWADSRVLRSCSNLKIRTGRPVKAEENPLFRWKEQPLYRNYPNVLCDPEGMFRCYYTVLIAEDGQETPIKAITALAYAVSRDGVHWEKPCLGLVSYQGDTNNNLIRLYAHGSCVFYDGEEERPERRYKLLTRDDREPAGMCIAYSADGISFGDYIRLPLDPRVIGDTHNFCFYDGKQKRYLMTSRMFSGHLRLVAGSSSEDFEHWTEHRQVFRGDDMRDQAYSMPVFFYAGQYFALPSIYHEGDRDDPLYEKVECELLCGADGESYSRIAAHKPFLPLGAPEESDNGCIYMSAPVDCGEEFWFYYTGARGVHSGFQDANLHLARLRKEHLLGVHCRNEGREGRLLSRPLEFQKAELELYVDIRKSGYVKARLLEADGRTEVKGYGFAACRNLEMGEGRRALGWEGQTDPDIDREYVLELAIYQAVVYQLIGAECCAGYRK